MGGAIEGHFFGFSDGGKRLLMAAFNVNNNYTTFFR
jgi:hypothetical protein